MHPGCRPDTGDLTAFSRPSLTRQEPGQRASERRAVAGREQPIPPRCGLEEITAQFWPPIVKENLAAIDASDQTPSHEGLEGYIAAKTLAEAVRRAGRNWDKAALLKAMSGMNDYDVGGFRINLRAGVRDSIRAIDLVTITADGKVVR